RDPCRTRAIRRVRARRGRRAESIVRTVDRERRAPLFSSEAAGPADSGRETATPAPRAQSADSTPSGGPQLTLRSHRHSEHVADELVDLLRRVRGSEALDDSATAVDEELREVPFDRLGAEHARFLALEP